MRTATGAIKMPGTSLFHRVRFHSLASARYKRTGTLIARRSEADTALRTNKCYARAPAIDENPPASRICLVPAAPPIRQLHVLVYES